MRPLILTTILILATSGSAVAAPDPALRGIQAAKPFRLIPPSARSSVRTMPGASEALLKPYVVVEFGGELSSPSGMSKASAEHRATAYCKSAKYKLGKPLEVSAVPGKGGRFSYYNVSRLICFN
jgi:hypothetical protein